MKNSQRAEKAKIYRANNPRVHRENHWKKLGIKNADGSQFQWHDYEVLKAQLGGKCSICSAVKSVGNWDLCVDHNHSTGVVRGLLCIKCNRILGSFKDDVKLVKSAFEYLQKYTQEV